VPQKELLASFEKIRTELRSFIDLSLHEDEKNFTDWVASVAKDISPRCWEVNKCNFEQCPAYGNTSGRCWLIAGTMCGSAVTGKFAKKYSSCRECDFYRKIVYQSPLAEITEHIIILIYSLRIKQDELKQQALTDQLTGLNNRRYFDLFITREIDKLKRAGGRLAFLMVDINNFKHINDSKGHVFGDYILKEFAQILQNASRTSDLVIRYGGDEFLITMYEENDSEKLLIERINKSIAAWNQLHSDYPLSLSFGVSYLALGDSVQDVIEAADRKMYQDKLRQKNLNNYTGVL